MRLLNGHEFEQALGVGDGQGSLACCSPWGRKESDMTERLNWTQYLGVISIKSATYSQAIHDRGAHLEPHRTFSSVQNIFGWKQGHGGRGGMGPAICWTEARNAAKYSPMYRATLHNKDLLNPEQPRKPDR